MTILSVDDDPTNQIVIKRLLSNYNIIHAMSGKPSANDIYKLTLLKVRRRLIFLTREQLLPISFSSML